MNKLFITLIFLTACGNITPSGDMTSVGTPTAGGLTGGSNTGSANLSIKSCSADQLLEYDGDSWECIGTPAGGTVVSVQTSAVTGTQNDFALSAGTTLLRFTSASTTTLTGMLRSGGNVDGDCVDIQYEGAAVFNLGSSGGTATNNFRFNNSVTTFVIGQGNVNTSVGVRACYSSTTTRWSVEESIAGCGVGQAPVNVSGSGVICTAIGDILGVTAGTGLTGGGTTGTPTVTLALTPQNCSAGTFFDENTATGVFTCVAEVGDISGVTATAPLSGGACTSGACTIGMSNGDRGDITQSTTTNAGDTWSVDASAINSSKIADGAVTFADWNQNSCATDDIPKWNGSAWACASDATGGGGISGLTTGTIPIASSATTIGDSLLTYAASTWSMSGTLNVSGTVTGATGVFASSFATGIASYGVAFALGTNAPATGHINAVGYNEGTTQTRSLAVFDGTGSTAGDRIALFDGTDRSFGVDVNFEVGGTSTLTGDLIALANASVAVDLGVTGTTTLNGATLLNGNATFGDAAADQVRLIGGLRSQGTPPTPSSCGTGASVTGGRNAFTMTIGTVSATGCTLDWATPFPDTIHCMHANAGATYLNWTRSTSDTDTFVFMNQSGASAISTVLEVLCWSY